VNLRRTVYLTIQSTYSHKDCLHKFLKLKIGHSSPFHLCGMILDCCMVERVYQRFYGLLVELFCRVDGLYLGCFQRLFALRYARLEAEETGKIRNLAKLYGYLVGGVMGVGILQGVRLTQEETTPSSRIFVKILFKEMAENMGIQALKTLI
jgi:pre-mRNA-splicing factor CWC22